MLDPDENGELPAVSWSPPAECDRSHSFASSWLRSWEEGVYLHKANRLFQNEPWQLLNEERRTNEQTNHEMSQSLRRERGNERWKNLHIKCKDFSFPTASAIINQQLTKRYQQKLCTVVLQNQVQYVLHRYDWKTKTKLGKPFLSLGYSKTSF